MHAMTTRVPLRAQALLKILMRYRGKNEKCWPSQKLLADEMAVSVRTVKHWIAHLAAAGEIEIEKTGRTNNYWIPHRPSSSTIGEDFFPYSKDNRGRNLPLRGEETCPSEGKKSSPIVAAPLDELDSAAASASAAAAADQDFSKCIEDLEALGMPAIAKPLAAKDSSLAAAVLEHCRWRFQDQRGLAPIANRPGYVLACLKRPADAGFIHDDSGAWKAPPGQPRPQAEKKEHPRVQEQLELIRGFDALPSVKIREIEDFVRERAPLFASKSSASGAMRLECIAVYAQWQKEGKL